MLIKVVLRHEWVLLKIHYRSKFYLMCLC